MSPEHDSVWMSTLRAGPIRPCGEACRLPDRIALGWYAQSTGPWGGASGDKPVPLAEVGAVHAGERWQFTVRLKAPHGNVNPFGFDSELWSWEQGVHANGSVRTGARDTAPKRIAVTWLHPVERAREAVRDAVFERVPDRAPAGVIAALVTGDQSAIDRARLGRVPRNRRGAPDVDLGPARDDVRVARGACRRLALAAQRAARCCVFPPRRPRWSAACCCAGLYALFSGWGVPSQRTVWMLATVALLRLTGRRWPWPLCGCWPPWWWSRSIRGR